MGEERESGRDSSWRKMDSIKGERFNRWKRCQSKNLAWSCRGDQNANMSSKIQNNQPNNKTQPFGSDGDGTAVFYNEMVLSISFKIRRVHYLVIEKT